MLFHIMYSILYIMCIEFTALCSMNCIILMEFHALYSRNCIYSMHLFHTSYFLYYILCISFSAFYSLHLIPCIVVYVSCILYFMHKRNKLVHCSFCRNHDNWQKIDDPFSGSQKGKYFINLC